MHQHLLLVQWFCLMTLDHRKLIDRNASFWLLLLWLSPTSPFSVHLQTWGFLPWLRTCIPFAWHPPTLGLRGAAQKLLHVEVQTALSCLGCVNSVLPGLKSVFFSLRPLFSWRGLIKTSLPCFLPWTPPKEIYITVDKYSICCKN